MMRCPSLFPIDSCWSLVLLIGVVSALTGPAAGQEAIYRETFPVPAGNALKLTDAGWEACVYSSDDGRMHHGAAGYTPLMRDKRSQPASAVPVNSAADPGSLTETGMLVNWNGGALWRHPTLYLTEEFGLDAVSRLTSVSWFQNNHSKEWGFRVALKIGTTWVVSDQNFVGFGQRSLEVETASWRHLNPADLSIDAEATLSKLPEGPLRAFGVYGKHTGYAELDTFTLSGQPSSNPAAK
ncbi:MAG: hypothetical protein AAF797_02965 [Planctomycetota bacterium]